MPLLFETPSDGDHLRLWRECRATMERTGMNPELLGLVSDLAREIREHDAGASQALLLARLAARLNALVVLEDVPGHFLTTLIGLTSTELER